MSRALHRARAAGANNSCGSTQIEKNCASSPPSLAARVKMSVRQQLIQIDAFIDRVARCRHAVDGNRALMNRSGVIALVCVVIFPGSTVSVNYGNLRMRNQRQAPATSESPARNYDLMPFLFESQADRSYLTEAC